MDLYEALSKADNRLIFIEEVLRAKLADLQAQSTWTDVAEERRQACEFLLEEIIEELF